MRGGGALLEGRSTVRGGGALLEGRSTVLLVEPAVLLHRDGREPKSSVAASEGGAATEAGPLDAASSASPVGAPAPTPMGVVSWSASHSLTCTWAAVSW